MAGLRGGQGGTASGGIGQGGAFGFGGGDFGLGLAALSGQFGNRRRQFGPPCRQPFRQSLGLIEGAQGAAFRLRRLADRAFAGDQFALQGRQFGLRLILRGLRVGGGRAQGGHFGIEREEAVVCFQPGRFRRAFAARHEAVPAAQEAVFRHQPFAGAKRAAIIGIGHMHQGQPCGEFRRALAQMRSKAACDSLQWGRTGPKAAFCHAFGCPEGCLSVAAQNCGERAFIAGQRRDLIQRRDLPLAPLLLL